jgi:hypothetical protein
MLECVFFTQVGCLEDLLEPLYRSRAIYVVLPLSINHFEISIHNPYYICTNKQYIVLTLDGYIAKIMNLKMSAESWTEGVVCITRPKLNEAAR